MDAFAAFRDWEIRNSDKACEFTQCLEEEAVIEFAKNPITANLVRDLSFQPMLKVQKAAIVRAKSGDATALRLALAGLPISMADDTGPLCWRLRFALDGRDWKRAKKLIEKNEG